MFEKLKSTELIVIHGKKLCLFSLVICRKQLKSWSASRVKPAENVRPDRYCEANRDCEAGETNKQLLANEDNRLPEMIYLAAELMRYQIEVSFFYEAELRETNPLWD